MRRWGVSYTRARGFVSANHWSLASIAGNHGRVTIEFDKWETAVGAEQGELLVAVGRADSFRASGVRCLSSPFRRLLSVTA